MNESTDGPDNERRAHDIVAGERNDGSTVCDVRLR